MLLTNEKNWKNWNEKYLNVMYDIIGLIRKKWRYF